MRQKYWYLGSICSVALTVVSIIACGDPSIGAEECTFDTDCSAGYICDGEEGFCVQTCATSAECNAGEICQPRASAPNGDKTCQADNTSTGECEENEECNSNELCINNVCEPINEPQDVYRYIQILDTSSGASSCESKSANGLFDAGSDIFSATLLNSDNEVIGYALATDYNAGTGRVDTADSGILDGNPRNLDARSCPAAEGGSGFRSDSVVSLGCGGYLLVGFQGNNGQLVNITNGMRIEVGEYAPTCNSSGGDSAGSDRYVINVCLDTDTAANLSATSCTRQLGSAAGGNNIVTVNGL